MNRMLLSVVAGVLLTGTFPCFAGEREDLLDALRGNLDSLSIVPEKEATLLFLDLAQAVSSDQLQPFSVSKGYFDVLRSLTGSLAAQAEGADQERIVDAIEQINSLLSLAYVNSEPISQTGTFDVSDAVSPPEGSCQVEIRNQDNFVLERRTQNRLLASSGLEQFFLVAVASEAGDYEWTVDAPAQGFILTRASTDSRRISIRLAKEAVAQLLTNSDGPRRYDAEVTVVFTALEGNRSCEETVRLVWGHPVVE